MGAVNFSIDLGLVAALKRVLPLDVLVETGTFRGDTVELVKDQFGEILTVELSPEYCEAARSRFADLRHVDIVHGDSAKVLTEWIPRLRERSVLYFLDAHWCVADNTAGEASQCPLLAEIKAIDRLNAESLVVIDDARLFLAPPPAPHEISQWPSLNEVIEALRGLSDDHLVMVLNDNIIYYPRVVEAVVRNYGHAHGVDWLDVLHKTRDYDNLHRQFDGLQRQSEEKDQEIKSLKVAGDEKDAEIDEKDAEIDSLKVAGDEKDTEIGGLLRVCQEREALIFYQARALRTHYAWRAWGIVRRLPGLLWQRMRQSVATAMAPRIGVLKQYSPRPVAIPEGYRRLPKLASLPRVSIVTPSFNQASFLEQTIRSVLDQGYPNLEYIVQDGGSKDGSREVLERYSSALNHWESTPDGGQTNAINLGFRHTTGEIMAYLNSDDLLLAGTLHYVVDFFNKHPEVDVVYGHRINIDEAGMEIGRWVLPPHDGEVLSWADFIPQETLFWRRRAWDRIGGSLDESFRFAMDWDLLLRFRDSGAKFTRLPRFLAAFRVHPQQKTTAEIGDTGFKEMTRLRERCLGRQPSHVEITKNVAPYLARHVLYDWACRIAMLLRGGRC